MVVPAGAVHMAVIQFFLARVAHLDDVDLKVQVLVRERMIAIERDLALTAYIEAWSADT